MRLRFVGFAHTTGYDGPSGRWSPGDEREVDEATGAGLLHDFPGAFERLEPVRNTMATPARDAVARPGRARR